MIKKIKYLIYRFQWNFYYRFKKAKLLNVDIELSSACTLRCKFCYHADQKNLGWEPKVISPDLTYKLLKMISSENIPAVKFNWRGEPLIHSYIGNFTRLALDLGILDRIINTNLNCREMKKLDALFNCTKIIVSIDAASKEEYEQLRVGGDWDILVRNLNYVYSKLTDQKLILQFVQTQDSDLNKIIAFSKKYPKAKLSIRKVFPRSKEKITIKEHDVLLKHKRKICQYPFTRMIISADGYVFPCCPDFNETRKIAEINQLYKGTLNEIFHSEKFNSFRRSVSNLDYELINPCKDCKSWISYK